MEDFPGTACRREGQPGHDQLRLAGGRQHPAHHDGANRQTAGHQMGPRSIQGRGRQHECAARRTYPRVSDSTGWAELVNAGKFRLLVTWGAERTKNWPNVPILKEIGIDIVSSSPFGLGGPKGMDPAVVKILHDAFKKGMEEVSYKEALIKFDQEAFYLNSADYHAYAMQQIVEQKQLVEELGLRQQ